MEENEEGTRAAGNSLEDEIREMRAIMENSLRTMERMGSKRENKTVAMKAKGNQKQYDYLCDIKRAVCEAKSATVSRDGDTVMAKLSEAEKILNKRIKLVKLADRSEFGWQTVEEYESDDLASDSEDDKKIKKAEAAVREKRKRSQQDNAGPSKRLAMDKDRKRSWFPASSNNHFNRTSAGVATIGNRQSMFFRTKRRQTAQDICYSCGEKGHWRADCARVQRKTGSLLADISRDESGPNNLYQ